MCIRSRSTTAACLAIVLVLLAGQGCANLPSRLPDGGDRQPGSATVPARIKALESDVAARVNAYRQSRGLPPLMHDDFLAALAREHSAQMAAGRRRFGHGGFEARARQIQEQRTARSVSENVAYNNYAPDAAAARVVQSWVESPGHHASLIGTYNRAGVGAAQSDDGRWYVTQLYAWVE